MTVFHIQNLTSKHLEESKCTVKKMHEFTHRCAGQYKKPALPCRPVMFPGNSWIHRPAELSEYLILLFNDANQTCIVIFKYVVLTFNYAVLAFNYELMTFYLAWNFLTNHH